jgi:hypothetical protein
MDDFRVQMPSFAVTRQRGLPSDRPQPSPIALIEWQSVLVAGKGQRLPIDGVPHAPFGRIGYSGSDNALPHPTLSLFETNMFRILGFL